MFDIESSSGKPASNSLAYAATLKGFKSALDVFFREIKTRGGYKVPKNGEGPVIFAAGPHNNLFVDGIVLASEVYRTTGRQTSFLVAEKSMHQTFIGSAARMLHSIPVRRPKDSAVPGAGAIYYHPNSTSSSSAEVSPLSSPLLTASTVYDFLILKGRGTKFTSELAPKKQIMLPKRAGFGLAEVMEVVDDETVKLRTEFNANGKAALLEAGWRGEGIEYKILPYIAQPEMYKAAFDRLREGGSIGIFPEGDTHDRADFLPLKAGLAAMALGAMAEHPGLNVRIVPTGLSFFHPDRFRSRAVVEFGECITIPTETVEKFKRGGEAKREAVSSVMSMVFDGLRSVTARAPDYETLMLIQAVRRLFTPPGQRLSLGQTVELNRRFISGYLKNQDEPRIVALKKRVLAYNALLDQLGLKDHQVEYSSKPAWRSVISLIKRILLLTVWGILALPGTVVVAPMMLAARLVSRSKAKLTLAASTVKLTGKDVLATWKVLTSIGMAPVLYLVYAGLSTYLAHHYRLPRQAKALMPLWTMIGLPTVAYAGLKFGEGTVDIMKSIKPLIISLRPGDQKMIERVRAMRASLADDIYAVVEELGPKTFDDWDPRTFMPASVAQAGDRKTPVRKATYPDLALFGIGPRSPGRSPERRPSRQPSFTKIIE